MGNGLIFLLELATLPKVSLFGFTKSVFIIPAKSSQSCVFVFSSFQLLSKMTAFLSKVADGFVSGVQIGFMMANLSVFGFIIGLGFGKLLS